MTTQAEIDELDAHRHRRRRRNGHLYWNATDLKPMDHDHEKDRDRPILSESGGMKKVSRSAPTSGCSCSCWRYGGCRDARP
jgi:hypothetical protein